MQTLRLLIRVVLPGFVAAILFYALWHFGPIGEGQAAQGKGKTQPKVYESGIVWETPKVVTPGDNGGPPSDAIILFDGKSMDAWKIDKQWIIEDGAATAASWARTKQPFGDCQLHV